MQKTVRKIINLAIALLAIAICFQIISVNKNRLFSSNDKEMTQYRKQIVSALNVKGEVKMADDENQTAHSAND